MASKSYFMRRIFLPLLLLLALSACVTSQPLPKRAQVSTTPPSAQKAVPAGNPAAQEALQAPARLPANVPVVRIALLLPLTGESQALGQAMLDAATLALYDAYVPLPPEKITASLVLLPKNTGNSPAGAQSSAESALEQGAQLIIGPLYGASVAAAAPAAQKAGVPMIALSNNKDVAHPGVYVFGFSPEQQVARVMEYALRQKLTSFGAMLPNDAYGVSVGNALQNALRARGVAVAPQVYARAPANVAAAAERLRGAYDKSAFQAVFLADGGDTLRQVLEAFKVQKFERGALRLIGTGLWDDDETRKIPEMQGAWFASSPPQGQAAFEKRFQSAYGYRPPRLASLAYDAVQLAAQMALQSGGGNFSADALTQPQGFALSANGLVRFRADGTTERTLAVMEIGPGSFKVLEPAAKVF